MGQTIRHSPEHNRNLSKAKTFSVHKILDKLQAKYGDLITVDPSTYLNTQTKARFIDKDYGEFWALPANILYGKGRRHPHAGLEAMRQKKTWPIQKVIDALQAKHGDTVTLDTATYTDTRTKARFIDKEYGAFWAVPTQVYGKGSRHAQARNVATRLTRDQVQAKLPSFIEVDWSTYTDTKTPARFIDKEYGEFWQKPEYVFSCPNQHPDRFHALKTTCHLLSADEIQQRLDSIGHGVQLIKETYTKMHNRATFIDPVYGAWEALPYNLIHSQTRHPAYKSDPLIEQTVANFLSSLGYTVRRRAKVLDTETYPLEIDAYCPDIQLGVELHGLYWHSTAHAEDAKHMHQRKADLADSAGIQLLQFFEDEVRDKADLVKSIIAAKLGQFDRRIYARSCTVKELDARTANEFCDVNHLQSRCVMSFGYGLYFGTELVALMTVRKKHRIGEIARFCSLKNTHVIGAAGKLFKQVVAECRRRKFTRILSYADRRISQGKIYQQLGFCLDGKTIPDMFWTNKMIRVPRQRSWSDPTIKTWYKIYGAGHLRFFYDLS